MGVLVQKKLDNVLAEVIFDIHHIKGNAQLPRNVTGIRHLVGGATAVESLFTRLAPQTHHHANNFITLLDEEGGRYRTIYTAAHGDDYARRRHGMVKGEW